MPRNWESHRFTATSPFPKTPQTTKGIVFSSPSVLDAPEKESIDIFRETAAALRKPVMLHSIGKDSFAALHLARKALASDPKPLINHLFRKPVSSCIPYSEGRSSEG